MSWGSYTLMKCKKCGKVYEVEDSTLIMNQTDYDKCPVCRSEGEIVSSKSILDVMNEQSKQLKKHRKRVIL